MFGFLKQKLKDALNVFSKGAKEAVQEEVVQDAAALEAAKREEEALLKTLEAPVEEVPESAAERAQHDRERRAREAKTARQVERPVETPVEKLAEKPLPKPLAKPSPDPGVDELIVTTPITIADRTEDRAEVKRKEREPVRAAAPEPVVEKTPEPRPKPVVVRKEQGRRPEPALEQRREPERGEPERRREERPEREPRPTVSPKSEQKPVLEQKPESKAGFFKSIFGKKPAEEKPADAKPAAPISVVEKQPVIEEKQGVERNQRVPEPVSVKIPAPVAPAAKPEVKAEPEIPELVEGESRGFFTRLKETFTKKSLSEEKFDELFWGLEVTLLENNVALEVIEKLKADLKKALTSGKVSRLGIEDLILLSLRESVEEVLDIKGFDLVERVKKSGKRPYILAFIGVNGSGKTTTLAKVANLFQEEGLSVVMAASDTFRAAAIDQLAEHAHTLGVKLISQGYGADPAAVAFDAVEHAKAKSIDVVMIDTAGRLHSNTNLMAELAKVIRVAKPDLKIFIGESITGNDCVEQAKEFDKIAGIDAIILSKADVDEKGGAALSVSYVTKKPILYLGVGQAYGDLKRFDKEEIVKSLGL